MNTSHNKFRVFASISLSFLCNLIEKHSSIPSLTLADPSTNKSKETSAGGTFCLATQNYTNQIWPLIWGS